MPAASTSAGAFALTAVLCLEKAYGGTFQVYAPIKLRYGEVHNKMVAPEPLPAEARKAQSSSAPSEFSCARRSVPA